MALFPDPEHYRTWVDWAKALTPIVKSSSAVKPVKLLPYGYDRLPNPSEDGMVVFVVDEASGKIPVYSADGVWKRFSTNEAIVPRYDPYADSNIIWHVDFSDSASITQSGGFIDGIADQTTGGNDLEQTTAARRYSFSAASVNGLDSAVCDDVDDYMNFKTGHDLSAITDQMSMTIVYSANPGGSFRNFWYKADTGTNQGLILQNDGSNALIIKPFASGNANTLTNRPSGCFSGNLSCLTIVLDAGVAYVYLNGVSQIPGGEAYTGTILTNTNNGTLFRMMNGNLCENFISNDAKSAEDAASIYAYAQAKWGVT